MLRVIFLNFEVTVGGDTIWCVYECMIVFFVYEVIFLEYFLSLTYGNAILALPSHGSSTHASHGSPDTATLLS